MNYKVRVKNEVESKEVQGLFFELGGRWASCGKTYNDMVAFGEYIFLTDCEMLNYGLGIKKEEITIPQLKDMVVLKRNDKNDANYKCDSVHKYLGYLTSDGVEYFWNYAHRVWHLSEKTFKSAGLKPIEREIKDVQCEKSQWDIQVGGDHYKSMKIQPAKFALENKLDYCQSNAIKYICRHESKNGKQDLEKAKHYIDLLIEHYYGGGKDE